MSKLQDTLDSLQPYVIGIRYIEGHVMVDCVLKEGWVIPESSNGVQKMSNKDLEYYYTLFSQDKNVGLDDILSYVKEIIVINQEREDKKALLISLVTELKQIFKDNKLTKLRTLKFTYSDEVLNGVDDISLADVVAPEEIVETPAVTEFIEEQSEEPIPVFNQEEPILEEGLSEEDREILEEEKRAAAYFIRSGTANTNKNIKQAVSQQAQRVELPPKPIGVNMTCDCDENEACDKCMDSKGF